MSNLLPTLSHMQAALRKMSLQTRFLLIIGSFCILLSFAIWSVFNNVIEHVTDRIGTRFAEKQVLYDKARTLEPLIRELALSREMADSTRIRRWAANEGDPKLREEALALLEKQRYHFQDGSYFVAIAASGNYYFNDANGRFTGKQRRYKLNPANPDDAWFFATLKSAQDYDVNVDRNPALGVTKVWINVLLRDNDKVLGVVGTGLDLNEFIRNVADVNQPGITNLFLNDDGSIQIYRDPKYIDLSSIVKSAEKRRSIDQLLDRQADRDWVRRAIANASADTRSVQTKFVRINGKHYLAGVAALPEVSWFDLTLIDLDVLLPRSDFIGMALAIGGAALCILLILALTLQKLVLKPVAKLTDSAARISQGNFVSEHEKSGSGEVNLLESQFESMSDSIRKTRNLLEEAIMRRTYELSNAKHLLEISLRQEKEGRLAQTNLLALMAHEVRSPVAVIGNTAQMLNALASSEKPEWLPRIEKIMVAVRQLANLANEILHEDRIALENNVLERHAGELNKFCAELCERLAAIHQREILFEPAAEPIRIDLDWHLVEVAVSNLIENAVKYSPPTSAIGLHAMPAQKGGASIEVRDHGVSISPAMRSHVFEKFARGQPIEDANGVGLGLYLVNWIAELHGGYAEIVESDEGNKFRITLN